jgi:hypothetical protein
MKKCGIVLLVILLALSVTVCDDNAVISEESSELRFEEHLPLTTVALSVTVCDDNAVISEESSELRFEEHIPLTTVALSDQIKKDIPVYAVFNFYNSLFENEEPEYEDIICSDNLRAYLQKKWSAMKENYVDNRRTLRNCEIYLDEYTSNYTYRTIIIKMTYGYGNSSGFSTFAVNLLTKINPDGNDECIVDWYVPFKDGIDLLIRPDDQNKLDGAKWEDEKYVENVFEKFDELLHSEYAHYVLRSIN